jgi:subtilisin family serine protease
MLCLCFDAQVVSAQIDAALPRIDPRAIEAAQQQERIALLVSLSDQPGFDISRQEQEAVLPDMEAIDAQIRQLSQPFELDDIIPEPVRLAAQDLKRQREAIREQMVRNIFSQVKAIVQPQQDKFVAFVEQELGGKVLTRLIHINALGIEIPSALLDRLSNHPEVLRVTLIVGNGAPELNKSIPTIGADTWHYKGYDGDNVDDIAILDSGVASEHPNLTVIAYRKFVPGWEDQVHGTKVAGAAVSNHDIWHGVAKGICRYENGVQGGLIDAVITDGIAKVIESDALAALEWVVTDGEGEYAEIVNFSEGFEMVKKASTDYTYIASEFDRYVADYWVSITESVGNEGNLGRETITVPAEAYNVISVGAMDDNDNEYRIDDVIWQEGPGKTSALGPTRGSNPEDPDDGERKKPDLVAPGVDIYTTKKEGGFGFANESGTSLAAPHVAGAIALLMDFGPWTPVNVKAILINTADDMVDDLDTPGWDNAHGWGYINMNKAWTHRWAWDISLVAPGESEWLTGNMNPGDKVTAVWNCHGKDPYTGEPVLSNINLFVWERNPDGTKGILLGASTSSIDNVEQVVSDFSSAVYVEVHGFDVVGSHERVSVAHPIGFTEVSPPGAPAKSVALSKLTADLGQNFPNPSNPETWIPYSLAKSAEVRIQIFNVAGELVRTLDIGRKLPGRHATKETAAYWDGRNDAGERASSGVYFYYLTAGDFKATRKMLLSK